MVPGRSIDAAGPAGRDPAGASPDRPRTAFLRIGHAGASAYAPANTLESFELALSMGVDMVELDVRPCRDALVLLHDGTLPSGGAGVEQVSALTVEELRARKTGSGRVVATLDEALVHLKGRALLNIDLKTGGIEAPVVDALRRHAVLGDALISSLSPQSLREVRAHAPDAATAVSYPEDRGGASTRPYLSPLVALVVRTMRAAMPYRILRLMDAADAGAAMLYHKVTSRATVERVHAAGKRVFAWTVDDLATMRRLHSCGVDGIASNRPDLFGQM